MAINFNRLLRDYMQRHKLTDADRVVTKQEARAYMYRHHALYGFSLKETAFVMNVEPRQIQHLLQNLKKKAPQLFPILTKQQVAVKFLITEYGYTFKQVGQELLMTEKAVANMVHALKKKGVKINRRVKMRKRYDTLIDGEWVPLEDMDNDDRIVGKY